MLRGPYPMPGRYDPFIDHSRQDLIPPGACVRQCAWTQVAVASLARVASASATSCLMRVPASTMSWIWPTDWPA